MEKDWWDESVEITIKFCRYIANVSYTGLGVCFVDETRETTDDSASSRPRRKLAFLRVNTYLLTYSSSIQVPDVKWASRVPRETYLSGDYSLVLIKASFVVGLGFGWQFCFWTGVLETLDFIPDEWTIIFDEVLKEDVEIRRNFNI